MANERSLPELKTEFTKHHGIASQRQNLYERLGDRIEASESGPVAALRVARMSRVRARVDNSRLRAEKSKEEVVEELQQQAGKIINQAIRYQDDLATMETAVSEMRKFAQHLPPGVLERRQEELAQLKQRPGTDQGLKTALELLEAQKKESEKETNPKKSLQQLFEELGGYTAQRPTGPKPPIFPRRPSPKAPEPKKTPEPESQAGQEVEAKPTIVIDLRARTISMGDILVKPRRDFANWPLLAYLAKNTDKPQNSNTLSAFLSKIEGDTDAGVGDRVGQLRGTLSKFSQPDLIAKSGSDRNASFQLNANVEWAGLFDIDQNSIPQLTDMEKKLVFELRFGSRDEPVSSNELTAYLYPDVEKGAAHKRLSTMIGRVREKLENHGYRVNNALPQGSTLGAKYYIEKAETAAGSDAEQDKDESVESEVSKLQAAVATLEQLAKDDPVMQGELEAAEQTLASWFSGNQERQGQKVKTIKIAHAHSNGVRSEEETAVIGAIAKSLTSGENLGWEQLHKQIAEFLTSDKYSEAESIDVVKPGILSNIFTRALEKMNNEDITPAQRATWSRTEREIWQNVQKLNREIAKDKFSVLKNKISGLLLDAYNAFLSSDQKAVTEFKI